MHNMHTCPLCKSEYSTLRALSCHRSKSHSTISEVEFASDLRGGKPTCACGCGQPTKFISLTKGWSKYVRGHNGFTEDARHLAVERSVEHRRVVGSWNRGLSKDDDQRVAAHAHAISTTLSKKYETHELVPWQLGQTKDTHVSLAKMAQTKVSQWASGHLRTWTDGHTKETSQKLRDASKKISKTKRDNYESANRITREELMRRIDAHSTLFNFDASQGDDYRARRQTRLKFTCVKCGGEQVKTLAMLEESPQCWKCAPRDSTGQREVAEYVRHILHGVDVKSNDRSIISPKELDIYIPQLSFAIEYNGLFYHCEDMVSRHYHVDKRDQANAMGIRLFNIFEDEWKNQAKREIIKSMLCERLGLATTIHARKTTIKDVDKVTRRQFFNDNHIDGDVAASVAFGLYHDDKLVSCVSLRKPMSRKWNKHIEIARSATIMGSRVMGGLGKLMNHVKNWAVDSGHVGILSYVDLRYGDGHGYQSVGLQRMNTIRNFWWTDMTRRFDRSHCTAGVGITEKQNAAAAGLRKIWGWGHSVHVMTL